MSTGTQGGKQLKNDIVFIYATTFNNVLIILLVYKRCAWIHKLTHSTAQK